MADGKLCKGPCGKWKDWDDFPRNNFMKDGRDHRCRECIAVRDKARVRRAQAWLKEYKETQQCVNCGEDHPAALDFHHRNPAEKRFSISVMVAKGRSPDAILVEISKCDVLCSNCHRKEHHNERLARAA